jgi:hypothetical protein
MLLGGCGGGKASSPTKSSGAGAADTGSETVLPQEDITAALTLFNQLEVPATSENADCSSSTTTITGRACGLGAATWTATVGGVEVTLSGSQVQLAISIFNDQNVPATSENADCSASVATISSRACGLSPARWTISVPSGGPGVDPGMPSQTTTTLNQSEISTAIGLFNRVGVTPVSQNADCSTSSGTVSSTACGFSPAIWTFQGQQLRPSEVQVFLALFNRANVPAVSVNADCSTSKAMVVETVCGVSPANWQLVSATSEGE